MYTVMDDSFSLSSSGDDDDDEQLGRWRERENGTNDAVKLLEVMQREQVLVRTYVRTYRLD